MFRALLPDGDITCSEYTHTEYGVELYTEADELIGFIPYSNLVAIIDEEIQRNDERSIM